MRKWMASFYMELLFFRRNYYSWIFILAYTIYLYIGYQQFLRVSLDVGQLLQSSGYIVMAAVIIGLFYGAYLSFREEKAGMSDVLLSLNGDAVRPIAKMAAWGLVSVLITAFAALELIVLIGLTDSEFIYFWEDIAAYTLLYWGFSLFVSGMIGYAWAQLLPSTRVLVPVLFMTWFMLSPYNDLFSFIVPKQFLLFLNVGEREISSTYRNFEGLHLTTSLLFKRGILLTAAICFLLVARLINRKRRISRKEFASLVSAFLAFVMLGVVLFPFSRSFMDSVNFHTYADYYLETDREYYLTMGHSTDNGLNQQTSSFEVDRYDITLAHDANEVGYTADMEIRITSDAPGSWLTFTLYHGFRVESVTLKGTHLDYKRQGDWLWTQWPSGVSQGKLTVHVCGNAGANGIVTERSFFLPATGAWYPIPGRFRVAMMSPYFFEPQYLYVQLPKEADFIIHVPQEDQIFSNLGKAGEHVFSGKAKGVALLKGNLIEKKIDAYQLISPPDKLDTFPQIAKEIQTNVYAISETLQVKPPKVPEKIFVIPSYSAMPGDAMIAAGDVLYINEHFIRMLTKTGLTELSVSFYTFFWNQKYHLSDPENGFIFSALLDFILDDDEHNALSVLAAEVEESGEAEDWLRQYLYRVYTAFKHDKKGARALVRKAYDQWLRTDVHQKDWELLLNEQAEG